MKPLQLTLVLAASLALCACNTVRQVELRTEPAGAKVSVAGQGVGTSPVTHGFDFKNPDAVYEVTVDLVGHVPNSKKISELYLDAMLEKHGTTEGTEFVVIKIDEDEAWTNTLVSRAANNWVDLKANSQMDQAQVWEILVNIVTKFYAELTNLDDKAGYIAAKLKSKQFKQGPTKTVTVRNQFFCSIKSRNPLIYKIKIESTIQEGSAGWRDYERVFRDDAKILEELQSRLVAQ